MQEMKFQSGALKQALNVFFKDELRMAFTNPAQAFVFLRSLVWLRQAAASFTSMQGATWNRVPSRPFRTST